MTVVQPNSIAGINSITVQSGNALAIHKSDGTLIREIVASTGISTYSSISVGSATTTNNADKSINIGLGASISQHADNSLSFGTNGDERFQIDSSGNVYVGGVGASATAGSLWFNDTSANASKIAQSNGNSALTFHTGSSQPERARIDSSGRVLIGTTTEGEASADDLTIANSGHAGITIRSGTSSWGSFFFSDGTSGGAEYDGAIEYKHGSSSDNYMRFRTAQTERLRITSGGTVNIGGDYTNTTGKLKVTGVVTVDGGFNLTAGTFTAPSGFSISSGNVTIPVSYTHLTLPTILLV